MGIDIDEAWEYFVPDPEIDEIVHGRRADDIIDEVRDIQKCRDKIPGIRVGRGNPDFFNGRLAPDPDKYKPVKETIPQRVCPKCKKLYQPTRSSQRYCNRGCYRPVGKPKQIIAVVKCRVCNKNFKPKRSNGVVCSRECVASEGGRSKRGQTKVDLLRFKELWESGTAVADIQKELGIGKRTVKVTRDKLQLKPRPVGHFSKKNLKVSKGV